MNKHLHNRGKKKKKRKKKQIKMCSEEDKKREQREQKKRWMDIMKCENSVREPSEVVVVKLGQCVWNNRE